MARQPFDSSGGGGGSSDSTTSYRDLIGDDSADDDSGGSTGVRDTASEVDEQTEKNQRQDASDPFDDGSTGSEVVSSGGDETRARATGSSSGSDDATATPDKTADDDSDGMVQDADDDVQKSMEQTDRMADDAGGTDARVGGVNRQTAEQIVREERQSEQVARDFRGIGTLLPEAPASGFGEFGGEQGNQETEQVFRSAEQEGAEFVTSGIDEGFEALTGSEPTGEAADATRSFGAALGGAAGGFGSFVADTNDAVSFVATGNNVDAAADDPITRAGQVGDAVVGAGVDFVDSRVRIDESARFNDESLRFEEPVVEVEPNKQGEVAGEVTFTAASTVAGTAAGSRLGTGSDLSGKALKKGASGVNRGIDAFDRRLSQSRQSGFIGDTRGQQQLVGGGGSSSSRTSDSGGGSGGGFEVDPDLLDDSLTQNQDFLRDVSQRERAAQDDFGSAEPSRGDGGGGVGNSPTPGGELGGGGSGPLLDADVVDAGTSRRTGGDRTAGDIADQQLSKESQSDFFGDSQIDGEDSARDIADAQLDTESLSDIFSRNRGTGVGVGVGVGATGIGTETGQDVSSDVDSMFETGTDGAQQVDSDINQQNDTDVQNDTDNQNDTDTRVDSRSRTRTRTRTETESTATRLQTSVNLNSESETRVDEIDLTEADDGDRRRRRVQGEIDTGEFEQDIFTPGEILSGEAGLDDL